MCKTHVSVRATNPGLDILCVQDARVSSGKKPRTRHPQIANRTFSSKTVIDARVSSHIGVRNPRLNLLKVQVTRLPPNEGLGTYNGEPLYPVRLRIKLFIFKLVIAVLTRCTYRQGHIGDHGRELLDEKFFKFI